LDLLFSVDMNRERQADQLIGIREQFVTISEKHANAMTVRITILNILFYIFIKVDLVL